MSHHQLAQSAEHPGWPSIASTDGTLHKSPPAETLDLDAKHAVPDEVAAESAPSGAVPQESAVAAAGEKPVSPEATAAAAVCKEAQIKHDEPAVKMTRGRFWLVYLSQLVSIFLFALDQLIVATAIPKITTEFNSLAQISWLANGFFITLLAFNLAYSQWLLIFPTKHVLLAAVLIFEAGSLACGAAQSMSALIFGRALAGLGASGLFSCNIILLAEITSMKDRGKYMSFIGVAFAIASVLGPLVGGAFSDHVSWRWCFYINLPFGGISFASFLFFLPGRPPLGQTDTYKGYGWHMLHELLLCDWMGAMLVLGWSCAFILALEWGGALYPWSDGRVIACLVLAAVLPFVFVAWEWWIGPKRAMMMLPLLKRRTIIGSAFVSAFGFALFMALVYYLSLQYQAVYNKSATNAGIRLLPVVLVQVIFLIGSARIVAKINSYFEVILVGPALLIVASGLLYSTKVSTPIGTVMGYTVIAGAAIGLFVQNVLVAAQYELRNEPKLIGRGTGILTFLGFIGRILGISVAGSIFSNQLRKYVQEEVPNLPGNAATAVVSSANAIWTAVPEDMRQGVLTAYTKALSEVYVVGIAYGGLALLCAFLIKREKMVTKSEPEDKAEPETEKGKAALVDADAMV